MSLTYEFVTSVPHGSRPIYVNASLLKRINCEQFVDYSQVKGYKSTLVDTIPQTGTALHAFASTYAITDNMASATVQMLQLAPNDPKIKSTLTALSMAFPKMPPYTYHKNGEPFVEQQLTIPWRRYMYNGQDVTIVLWARPDYLGILNDVLRLLDYKTSLYYKTEDALRKYEWEFQFKYYAWLIYEFGHVFLPLEIANLARDFRLTTQVVVAQVGSNPKWSWGPVKPFTRADVETIPQIVEHAIENVILPLNTSSIIPTPNGIMTNSCMYCDFKHVCHSTPDISAGILERNFVIKPYGPAIEEPNPF